MCKGRTTLVIAHRLSTIMHADKILVIEAGQVIDSGRHDELLRKGGRYALFYRLQLQHQEDARAGCRRRRLTAEFSGTRGMELALRPALQHGIDWSWIGAAVSVAP